MREFYQLTAFVKLSDQLTILKVTKKHLEIWVFVLF